MPARRGHGERDLEECPRSGTRASGSCSSLSLVVALPVRSASRWAARSAIVDPIESGWSAYRTRPSASRIDTRAIGTPEDAAAHQLIDREETGGVASHDPVGEPRLHDPLTGHQGDALGLAKGLFGPQPAHHEHPGDPHEDEDHQAGHRECEHGPCHGGLSNVAPRPIMATSR